MSRLNTTHLHRIFNKLDINGDGLVNLDGVAARENQCACGTGRARASGGRKVLGLHRFLVLLQILIKVNMVQEECSIEHEDDVSEMDLRKVFRVFDLNGDGFISCEELRISLSRLGLWDERCGQDCKSMIDVFDKNSDGFLDFEDFKDMMLLKDDQS